MSSVRFKIIVAREKELYHPSDISINSKGGDVYYFPSEPMVVGSDSWGSGMKSYHHFSLHKDGNSHAKDTMRNKYSGPHVSRIISIGYQQVWSDTIGNIDYVGIPKINKSDHRDVVFVVDTDLTSFSLNLSIVSGRLIAERKLKRSRVGDGRLLDVAHRAIGHESGNGDKILQISLCSIDNPPSQGGYREIIMHKDSGIIRPEYE